MSIFFGKAVNRPDYTVVSDKEATLPTEHDTEAAESALVARQAESVRKRRALKHGLAVFYLSLLGLFFYRHSLASWFSAPKHHGSQPSEAVPIDAAFGEHSMRMEVMRLLGMPEDAAGFLVHQSEVEDGKRITPKEAHELFLTVPDNTSAHARSVLFATLPHRAASDQDLITALHTLSHFQSALGILPPRDPPIYDAGSVESQVATLGSSKFGGEINAWIDKYYPVMNAPISHSVEVLDGDGNVVWAAPLEEIPLKGDPAGEYAADVGAWHGLSKNGTATGQLVYAGYGSPEEFAALAEEGAPLYGCVALVQYGKLFRGLKVKAAEEAGCVATLIYSDPADDNGVLSPTYAEYPDGPARAPTAIQRGSVQYLSLYPGDPTTPGEPAYPNATRLDGGNIPGIPSLPLSMANAEKLKEEVRHEGRRVRVVNVVDDKVMPIWNTMAVIPGHIADEVVVLGNHRDAWVTGAADPTSGSATVHEIVEGISVLLKKGWRPLRTLMFASWDAEEYGLIGSTEWGEDFAEWISEHVVAYLNVDVSSAGSRLHIGASPSLAHLVRSSAERVPHPTDPTRTLWDSRTDNGPYTDRLDNSLVDPSAWRDERLEWRNEEEQTRARLMGRAAVMSESGEEVRTAEYTGVTALGSGSDYTVFLQHIGVASTDGGFAGVVSDAVYHYHSVYDSVTWMELYGDPGYHRHTAVAKYLGLTALRLADAIVLPLNTTQYAFELSYYLSKVEEVAAVNNFDFDFSALRSSIVSLQDASLALDKEKEAAEANLIKELKKFLKHHSGHTGHKHAACARRRFRKFRDFVKRVFGVRSSEESKPSHGALPKKLIQAAKRVRTVNKQLASFEGQFISPEGLNQREWYRNLLVAPGLWLGYGVTTLPGLTEAFTIDKNSTLAGYEASRLVELIEKATTGLAVKSHGCGSRA